ncbi:FMN-dependent NADH-azoreductase [Bradyrhizobium sp. UASWS1016]|jgi:FMN-dependent NADH-azoreductase|uniref:FMN-dependent NADH-azoreductase n=1 Tax=Bradyrhizobium sp. UASWS1016 TaxID=1566379 RepID=UPI00085513D7|nr:FMN-dependent NADH-azoreductase [Bradyrhizobium sp. UASWS1016]MBK5656644.1 FMN-dependent NADH-azoreductase [Rhizobium sp.]OCX32987.1 FMN-dependent NADH-azoreductase [Bradyrhizobium sp. UASWS1016]
MKLLHIDSSILGHGSVSRILSAETVAALRAVDPSIEVTYRDLSAEPLAHLTASHLGALQGAPVDAGLQSDVAAGKAALDEFLAADVVVIGAPMYNFGIPSQLKAWIDRLAVAGKTFRYGAMGPEGLCGGKKVVVASSRGGVFSAGTPAAAFDFQETYLRALFGFLGITDVTFVRAEGVAMGPEARTKSIEAAKAEATKLAA